MTSRSYAVVDGKVQAPILELGVAEHCNLACRSCSHLSPVLPKHYIDPAAVSRELELLGRHYHVESVRLLGGEPLLHRGIEDVIAAVRESGVTDSICVYTNGLLLPRMSEGFWQSVDSLEVALYPGKELSEQEQESCRERAAAGGAAIAFHAWKEFRQAYSEQGTQDPGLSRAIFERCLIVHEWRGHTLANGRFFKCPHSYYLPKALEACADNAASDSIAVTDSWQFGADLLAFLESPEPLLTCGHCLGTSGRRFAHTQVRRTEFRKLQQHPAEELVDYGILYPRVRRFPRARRKVRWLLDSIG